MVQKTHGFEDLELPSGHKDVVQALVKTHFRRLDNNDGKTDANVQFDLVRNKGKGLIILLHGVSASSCLLGIRGVTRRTIAD